MAGNQSRERRRLASECLALARETSDVQAHMSLLDMAQRWLDLAEISEYNDWNQSLRRRAIQATIGEGLRKEYDLPQELPQRLLALLNQLNAEQDAPEQA
jgi:hypothetical protein